MKKLLTVSVTVLLLLALTACTSSQPKTTAKPVVLTEIYADMGKNVTLPVMVEQTDMAATFGIEKADYSQSCVFLSDDPLKADAIVMFMAVDSAAATRIEKALNTYRDAKSDEAEGYDADQFAVIQASPVERSAYYVCYIASPDRDALMTVYSTYIK